MRIPVALWAALACWSAIGGCGRQPASEPAVARVGDVTLTEADLRASLPLGTEFGPQAVADARLQLIERWVERELLYQEALRRGMERQPRLAALIEDARRDLLAAALVDAELGAAETDVTSADIEAYYAEHQADYQRTAPEIHAEHVLLASQRDANACLQALQRGESFSDQAERHSLDPDTRYQGGDLGFFSEERDPVLWAACRDLPPNVVSKPVRTIFGYHLFRVLERAEAGTVRPVEQVRDQIVEALVRQRHQERLAGLLDRLRQEHRWQIQVAVGDSL